MFRNARKALRWLGERPYLGALCGPLGATKRIRDRMSRRGQERTYLLELDASMGPGAPCQCACSEGVRPRAAVLSWGDARWCGKMVWLGCPC